jgi:hypothetical protein
MRIKKALLLRQQVPKDKKRITFYRLEDVDDMWINLFFHIHKKLEIEHSEIWMWGGERQISYKENFVERWYNTFPTDIDFDFIFSRGGFPQYIPVMRAASKAIRLYYAAIFKGRYNPEAIGDTTKYDLILADGLRQYVGLLSSGYNVMKFLKPACENIFYPINNAENKIYDVIFIANALQKNLKGHEWFLNKMKGTNLKILQVGNLDQEIIDLANCLKLNITFYGWVPRKEIRHLAATAKVGVCCSEFDSCPRVIPEMLAMNLPVVVRESSGLHIWPDYFDDRGCVSANDDNFVDVLREHILAYDKFETAKFYRSKFSLDIASDSIIKELRKVVSQDASQG